MPGHSVPETDNYSINNPWRHWNIASPAHPFIGSNVGLAPDQNDKKIGDRIHSIRASDWPIRWGGGVRGFVRGARDVLVD